MKTQLQSHRGAGRFGWRIARLAFAFAVASAGLIVALGGVAQAQYGGGRGRHGADGADQVARGKYLVTIASCTDCHTPGHFLGKEDSTKFLGGSDVGFAIPGLGIFVAPNLTPDKTTGLGNWSAEQIVTAITTGKIPDGRLLAPIMPYDAYAHLTKADALAIAAYLKSLPPVQNQVAGPFGPGQPSTVFVMAVLPAAVFNGLPPPGPPPGAGPPPGGPPPGGPPPTTPPAQPPAATPAPAK